MPKILFGTEEVISKSGYGYGCGCGDGYGCGDGADITA